MLIFSNPTTCVQTRCLLCRQRRWWGNKGLSSIAAVLTLLILAALGGALTYMVAAGSVGRGNHLSSAQAFYVTQAGIEYGIKRIYSQLSEIVAPPGKTFGPGSFTISRLGQTLTITGTVGDAVRVYKVDSPTQADCTVIDTSNTNLTKSEKRIGGISFKKVCLTSIIVDKIQVSWVTDNGEKIVEIKIESSIIYVNPSGATSGTTLETVDYAVTNGNNNVINWIEFNNEMEDKNVTLSLIMSDGSIKTETFETDD